MADELNIPRTMSEELAKRLHENVIWIDLRTKLMMLLRKQSDEGDERATTHISFVAENWPGGSGPRQHYLASLEHKIHMLEKERDSLRSYITQLTGEDDQ